jgi:hypothetical protein
MGSCSTYLKKEIYNHIFRDTTLPLVPEHKTMGGITYDIPNKSGSYYEIGDMSEYLGRKVIVWEVYFDETGDLVPYEVLGSGSFFHEFAGWSLESFVGTYYSGIIICDDDYGVKGNLLFCAPLDPPMLCESPNESRLIIGHSIIQ